jgi:hypothetical protein
LFLKPKRTERKIMTTKTGDLFVWMSHEQAPLLSIVKTMRRMKNSKLYGVDDGSTFYTCIVAPNKTAAKKIYAKHYPELADEVDDYIVDWKDFT